MWTIKDLTERFGLTEKQVRSRLNALDPVCQGHYRNGKQNALLLDDYAFKLFDQLIQVEKEGMTTKDAVNQLANELKKAHAVESRTVGALGHTQENDGQAKGEHWAKLLVEALQERVNALERDKTYLQRQIEQLLEQLHDKDSQIKALMPPQNGHRRRWWQIWR